MCYKVGKKTAVAKLKEVLHEDTIAVNNFAQSTQSEHGPDFRAREPVAGSLMKALFDKVDFCIGMYLGQNLSRARVEPVMQQQHAQVVVVANAFLGMISHLRVEFDLIPFLDMHAVTALACVCGTQWRGMPLRFRDLIELKVAVIKFACGRSVNDLIRQVTTLTSQRFSLLAAVYEHFEVTGKQPLPRSWEITKTEAGGKTRQDMELMSLAIISVAAAGTTWHEDDQEQFREAISVRYAQVRQGSSMTSLGDVICFLVSRLSMEYARVVPLVTVD